MRINEILKSSLTTLRMNGRRTFLTMIGIIIGIASVITILSLGNGFQKNTMDQLLEDSQGRINQEFWFSLTNPDRIGDGDVKPFSQDNMDTIRRMDGVDDVENIEKLFEFNFSDIKYRDYKDSVGYRIVANTDREMAAGRNLNQLDTDTKAMNAIVSVNWLDRINVTPENILQRSIEINGETYTIVGVFIPDAQDEMEAMNYGTSFDFCVAQGSYMRRATNTGDVPMEYTLKVYFKEGADIKGTSTKISEYLKKEGNGLRYGEYMYQDKSEALAKIGQYLEIATLFVSAVAAISLFIAGVGVMNMMYISVSERTHEIGIRRSLGATKGAIQLQFLLEGIVITTLGGVIGFLVGYGLSVLIGNFLPFPPVMDLKTAMVSVIISIFIGIVFSVFPSRQASQKNVVEILR